MRKKKWAGVWIMLICFILSIISIAQIQGQEQGQEVNYEKLYWEQMEQGIKMETEYIKCQIQLSDIRLSRKMISAKKAQEKFKNEAMVGTEGGPTDGIK